MINIDLADSQQTELLQNCWHRLTTAEQTQLTADLQQRRITALVDGRGLACPMPLLKTKVALRDMQADECVYVIATDPHSPTDLTAFCQQSGLTLLLNTQTTPASAPASEGLKKLDTIFHLIITKTYGN